MRVNHTKKKNNRINGLNLFYMLTKNHLASCLVIDSTFIILLNFKESIICFSNFEMKNFKATIQLSNL